MEGVRLRTGGHSFRITILSGAEHRIKINDITNCIEVTGVVTMLDLREAIKNYLEQRNALNDFEAVELNPSQSGY